LFKKIKSAVAPKAEPALTSKKAIAVRIFVIFLSCPGKPRLKNYQIGYISTRPESQALFDPQRLAPGKKRGSHSDRLLC
jgi:hypothetical protein